MKICRAFPEVHVEEKQTASRGENTSLVWIKTRLQCKSSVGEEWGQHNKQGQEVERNRSNNCHAHNTLTLRQDFSKHLTSIHKTSVYKSEILYYKCLASSEAISCVMVTIANRTIYYVEVCSKNKVNCKFCGLTYIRFSIFCFVMLLHLSTT